MKFIKLKGGLKQENMKNKTMYGVFTVMALAILTVGSVAAFGPGFGYGLSEEDQAEREAFREELQTAVEAGDFDAWKELMQSRLTEEQFAQMQERHSQMSEIRELKEQLREAYEAGDMEKGEELKAQIQELMSEKANAFGKGDKKGFGKGFKKGFGKGMNKEMGMGDGNCPFAE